MRTRITELLGIKYPIILPGMSFISVPELVAAVSNAGGLGILATAPLGAKDVRKAIQKIRKMTTEPFGANIPLLLPNSKENLKVMIQEEVPIINIVMGKGDQIVKAVHEYGGKVIATVVSRRHARSAEQSGCDAIIATGHEAAAHGDVLTTFTLIPLLVNEIEIPVIAAGGIADGRGLLAAMALGADGVAMGSRLMMSKESPLHNLFKDLSIKKHAEDTLFSDRFDGLPCRILDAGAARLAIKKGFCPVRAFINSKKIAANLESNHFAVTLDVIKTGLKNAKQLAYLANAYKAFHAAIVSGNEKEGVLPVGQAVGLIHDEKNVEELFSRIISQAEKIQRGMVQSFA